MLYKFNFYPYQQPFQRPIYTSHGCWKIREGIIISLTDETNRISWGEIAPISWFGSETIEEAIEFCSQLPTQISEEIIWSIPTEFPACQFGFESAILFSNSSEETEKQLTYSALLPAEKLALSTWKSLWEQDYHTFKWKIGVAPIQTELEIFTVLIQQLPKSAKLRLDANGGLTEQEAQQWLEICDRSGEIIEFIEQPLPVSEFRAMQKLNQQYSTAIALDESVANFEQMKTYYHQGWRGIFVIKPAIFGFPSQLSNFCQNYHLDLVFSSVFETPIGRQAALKLAASIQTNKRAVGFGTNHWFPENNENWLKILCLPL